MTKRELKTIGMGITPVVRLTDKVESKFTGILKASTTSKFGLVFTFAIQDGDAPIKKKEGDLLIETSVNLGDEVVIFASGQLKDKLLQAQIGEKIEIEYKGKKVNPKTGRAFNDYIVSVVEQ